MKFVIALFITFSTTSAHALVDIANNTSEVISGFALSPNGQTVVYAKGSQVFAMKPDGSQVRSITGITMQAFMGINRISISPDSRYIAFDVPTVDQNQNFRDNFWIADLQTLKAVPVATNISELMDASTYLFTPDSKYYLYPTRVGDNWVIKRLRLADGRLDQLIGFNFSDDSFFMKPISNLASQMILIGLPQKPFMQEGVVAHSLLNWETGKNQVLNLPNVTNRNLNVLGVSPDTSQLFYVQCANGAQKFYSYDTKLNTSAALQQAPGCLLDWSYNTTVPPAPQVGVINPYLFFNNYANDNNDSVAGFYAFNVNTKTLLKISTVNAEGAQLSNDQTHVFYNQSIPGDLTGFNFDLYYAPLNGQKEVQYAKPTTLPLVATLGYLMNPQQSAVFLVRGQTGGPSSSPFVKANFWKLSVNGADQLLGEMDGHLVPNRDAARACAMDPQGRFVICNAMDPQMIGHLYRFAL